MYVSTTRMKKAICLILLFFCGFSANAQLVKLKNKSFEGIARKGVENFYLDHWGDCGKFNFRRETPPDVHPSKFWKNTMYPANGETYLGLVVRPNGSFESVTQGLTEELQAGQCYVFSIDLAISENYWSGVQGWSDFQEYNYNTAVILRMWGSQTPCYTNDGSMRSQAELLAESIPVTNNIWQNYIFEIEPSKNHKFITLEAFFKPSATDPYTGHVLVDNASHFIPIECANDMAVIELMSSESTDLAAIDELPDSGKKLKITKVAKTEPEEEKVAEEVVAVEIDEPATPPLTPEVPKKKDTDIIKKIEPKILTELDVNTIKKGQIINVKNLYFEADTSSISSESYDVLDEIYEFLKVNTLVNIEIGGHTNGTPNHSYCDKLSTTRAKSVARYLIKKGIAANRLKFKGYGKRNPIASNKTAVGRAKNQRVEIKILTVEG